MHLNIIDNRIHLLQDQVIITSYTWLDLEHLHDNKLIWYFNNVPCKFNMVHSEEIKLYKQLLEMDL